MLSSQMLLLSGVMLAYFLQILRPLAPGVESIWEPLQEEIEEQVEEAERLVDESLHGRLTVTLLPWRDEGAAEQGVRQALLYQATRVHT